MDNEERDLNLDKTEDIENKEDVAKWYVIHTYSGHENKVKANMEAMVVNRKMENFIYDIQVPVEEYVEDKEGSKKVKERKMFPSYVLVKMIMNDESWYLVRNTRGVTGFVGPASKPVPLSDEEVLALGVCDQQDFLSKFEVGDSVEVLTGAFKDLVGKIESINPGKGKVKVIISLFGRDTIVELDFNQISKQ